MGEGRGGGGGADLKRCTIHSLILLHRAVNHCGCITGAMKPVSKVGGRWGRA